VKDCGVAVVRLPGQSWAPNSSNGGEVNVGTARGCPPFRVSSPAGGQAHRQLRATGGAEAPE
jgi:hypothetical protein